jgi:hypothetical protein
MPVVGSRCMHIAASSAVCTAVAASALAYRGSGDWSTGFAWFWYGTLVAAVILALAALGVAFGGQTRPVGHQRTAVVVLAAPALLFGGVVVVIVVFLLTANLN